MKELKKIYQGSILCQISGLGIIATILIGITNVKLLDNATTMIVLGTIGSFITLNIIYTKFRIKHQRLNYTRNSYLQRSKEKIASQALLAINLLIIHSLMAIVVVYFTPVAIIRQVLTFIFAAVVFIYLSIQLRK